MSVKGDMTNAQYVGPFVGPERKLYVFVRTPAGLDAYCCKATIKPPDLLGGPRLLDSENAPCLDEGKAIAAEQKGNIVTVCTLVDDQDYPTVGMAFRRDGKLVVLGPWVQVTEYIHSAVDPTEYRFPCFRATFDLETESWGGCRQLQWVGGRSYD